jgi:hypothetical protein
MGYARIVVEGAGAPLSPALTYVIRREGYQEANLGHFGWQVQEERLQPVGVLDEAGASVLIVGPAVTRYLESQSYVFQIPGTRVDGHMFWPDDIDIFDGELPPERPKVATTGPALTAAQPELTKPEPVHTPVVTPTPVKPPEPKPVLPKKSHALYYVLGILLLLIAAAAVAWFASPDLRNLVTTKIAELTGRTAPPVPAPQQAETPPATPPATPPVTPPVTPPATPPTQQGQATPPPPAAPVWPDGTDGYTAKDVVDKAPNAAGIHDVAARRQQAGRDQDALVLFEEAAERGHAPSMTSIARMYDPNGFVPGKPFRNPDPRNAADYYKRAVEKGDPAAAAPRAALKTWLEGEARNGNASAAAALREFF